MNDFTFTGQGFFDYLYWQTQDKKTLKKYTLDKMDTNKKQRL